MTPFDDPRCWLAVAGMFCAYMLGRISRAMEYPVGGAKQTWVVTTERRLEVRLADADGKDYCKIWLDEDDAKAIGDAIVRKP